jgi:spermidine synthase
MRFRVILGCLVLSGFSGLTYELLWTRLLSFTFGSTSHSFSAVLAVFFGGLALGAWAAGRLTSRIRRPIRAYALIEFGIGALGILLYLPLRHLDVVFTAIDPGSGLGGGLLRFAVSVPVLILPTFLMGATLPIACAGMIHEDEHSGRGIALIYGFNTLGACLGAYLATYQLIPAFGLFRALLVAVAANLAAGVLALAVAKEGLEGVDSSIGERESESEPVKEVDGLTPEVASRSVDKTLLPLAGSLTFLGGFSIIGLEVVWARLFSSLLQGTIYGVGAVLICFLVGIAIGSILVARHVPPNSNAGTWFAGLQTVMIGSILLIGLGTPRIAHTLGSLARPSDSFAPQHAQLAVVLLVLLVPTVCSGATFPILVKLVESSARRSGRALGLMYAANTVGSILGSLVFGFVMIPEFGSVGATIFAIALLGLGAALGGALLPGNQRRIPGVAFGALALVLVGLHDGYDLKVMALGSSQWNESFDDYRARSQQEEILYFAEGREATIAVSQRGGQRSLTINSLPQGGRSQLAPYHNIESVLVASVPLVHARELGDALVVGLGAGTTVELLVELGVARVTVVELEPRVADAVAVLYGGESPVGDANVSLLVGDARHHLLLRARRQLPTYDVIASMPFHPWAAPNLYTKELFELAKRNLAPGGVFSTWFGLARMDAPSVQSLFRAFCSVFPNYAIYYVPETGSYFLAGSNDPLTVSPERLERIHDSPSVQAIGKLEDHFFLLERLYASGNSSTPAPPDGIVNTDDSAFVEVHAPRAGSTSPVLRDFLPMEFLQPSMVPAELRPQLYAELLERLLGSPNGRFPLQAYPIAPRRARRTLGAVEGILSPEEVTYYQGRIAAASNEVSVARERLEEASRGTSEVAQRAALFLALSEHDEPTRREALMELAPTTDVLLALLELDAPAALGIASTRPATLEDDPFGWFLFRASGAATPPLTPSEEQGFFRILGPEIAGSTRLGLLELAEVFCREQGWDREAELFGLQRHAAVGAEVDRLRQRGLTAGNQGNFREAARVLWMAYSLQPGNDSVMRPLLRALVAIGDQERAAALARDYRMLGSPEAYIHSLFRAAQEGTLSFDSDSVEGTGEPPSSPGGGR